MAITYNQSKNFAYNQSRIGFIKIIAIGDEHLLRNINKNNKKLHCIVLGNRHSRLSGYHRDYAQRQFVLKAIR